MNPRRFLLPEKIRSAGGAVCRTALLAVSAVLIAAPLLPFGTGGLSGILGLLILVTGFPLLRSSYRKTVSVFLLLSLLLLAGYRVSPGVLIPGINSLLPIAAIMTVLQIFVVPIRAGRFDLVLENYLRQKFRKETGLYVFISLITHVIGSFMLFGTVPVMYSFFSRPVEGMVKDPRRFAVTAIGRSFSLVTLWAPGAVSVVLVLETTGANWFSLMIPALSLTLMGLATSILLEQLAVFRKHPPLPVAAPGARSLPAEREYRRIGALILVAAALITGILVLQKLNLFTTTSRVLVSGSVIAGIWILRYAGRPELPGEFRKYWRDSLGVVPDLAALFISIGMFTSALQNTPVIGFLQQQLEFISFRLGDNSIFLITPAMVLLSLAGLHPLISVVFLGKLFMESGICPGCEILIALSLLLGSAVSYSASPFAGNILTLSAFSGASPRQVAFSWNGLFSLIFLAEGLAVLMILKFRILA